ncbi:protein kinase, putative [Entamoeba histolytica KU27]|uniref:Protein kinase, putative n=1 Tax=Entamoeba histolytica KU27 TaxID=885311 RepID=M2QBJ5_ENTHI|nr:protein kinase, putative [Entamoeba histolytica KU27]
MSDLDSFSQNSYKSKISSYSKKPNQISFKQLAEKSLLDIKHKFYESNSIIQPKEESNLKLFKRVSSMNSTNYDWKRLRCFHFSLKEMRINDFNMKGIPIGMYNIMKYLYNSLSNNLDWFEQKEIMEFSEIRQMKKVDSLLSLTTFELLKNYSLKKLLQLGITQKDAERILLLCKQNDHSNYFKHLNKNSLFENEDFKLYFNLINKFNSSQIPLLNNICTIQNAFVLLKLFFLFLPSPIIPFCFLDFIKQQENCKLNNQIVINKLKELVGKVEFNVIKELFKFINEISEMTQLSSDEYKEFVKCYFNAMLQQSGFKKRFVKYFNGITENEQFIGTEYIHQIEGEIVVLRIDESYCPLYILNGKEVLDMKNTSTYIKGKLFITNYRVLFIPSQFIQEDFMRFLGECWIGEIDSIATFDKDEGFYVKFQCKNIRVLSYYCISTKFNFNEIIGHLQSLQNYPNEIISLPHNVMINKNIDIICSQEATRMKIISNEKGKYYSPNLPLYSHCVIDTIEINKPVVIVYQHLNKSKLLRLAKIINEDLYEEVYEIGSKAEKALKIYCKSIDNTDNIDNIFQDLKNFVCEESINSENIKSYNSLLKSINEIVNNLLFKVIMIFDNLHNSCEDILLINDKTGEEDVSIFSFLTQIIADPYYRTLKGFLILFQKEFIGFDAFISSQTLLLLVLFFLAIEELINQNLSQFQFDSRLTYFWITHIGSRRFNNNNENGKCDQLSAIINYIYSDSSGFINPFYKPIQTELIFKPYKCYYSFDKWLGYSKDNISLFNKLNKDKEVVQFSKRNISHFPPYQSLTLLLKDVLSIDLSSNRMSEFPPSLCLMTKLNKISLQRNEIYYITDEISKLTNLNELSLSQNNITILPSLISLPLKLLDISFNNLDKHQALELSPTIETFIAQGVKYYPTPICELTNLNILDLSQTKFELEPLFNNPPNHLKELILQHCELRKIPENITKLSVTKLDVSHNYIMKINHSFFSWNSLIELNLRDNLIYTKSVLFNNMDNLIDCHIDAQTTQSSLSCDTDNIDIQAIQQVIISGDELRNDVFQYLLKKMKKYGSIREIKELGFDFIIKSSKKKEKKGSSEVLATIQFKVKTPEEIEDTLWEYSKCIFVVCKSTNENSISERVMEMLKLLPYSLKIHFVSGLERCEKYIEMYKELSITVHKNIGDKNKWSGLSKKIFEQINGKVNKDVKPYVQVMVELNVLEFDQFCLNKQKFSEIVHCLNLSDKEKEIYDVLIKWGYFIQMPSVSPFIEQSINLNKGDMVLIDFSFFKRFLNIADSTLSINGFFTVKIFERLNIQQENLYLLLTLLQQFGICYILTKQFAAIVNEEKRFNELYSELINNKSETPSIEGTISSCSCSCSVSSEYTFRREPKTKGEMLNLENVLIYPSCSFKTCEMSPKKSEKEKKVKTVDTNYLKENSINKQWPSHHYKNEVEVGRVLTLMSLNFKILSCVLAMVALKYHVIIQWKSGILVYLEVSNEQNYIMIYGNLNQKTIIIRQRYLITSGDSCFIAINELKEITEFIHNILSIHSIKIKSIDIYCPSCLEKGVFHIVNQESLKKGINQLQAFINDKQCSINLVLSSFDLMIKKFNNQYLMDINNFKFKQRISNGSNSIINLFETLKNINGIKKGTLVIIKQSNFDLTNINLHKDKSAAEIFGSYVQEYLREMSFIGFSSNNYIAKIYGFSIQPLSIIMEYFNGGNLFNLLHDENIESKYSLTPKILIQFATQIAEGLNTLHHASDPILHRDVKSPNVVIRLNNDELGTCAITDFGCSIPYSLNNTNKVECPYWLAPECIINKKACLKSDVYSFGMVLWEMSTKKIPFEEFRFFTEIEDKVISGYRPPLDKKEIYFNRLIEMCWKSNPDERPSFDEILKLLKSINVGK